MIHRPIEGLMDWLEEHVPEVRDLEVGTGGYSPLGHSPLALTGPERRAWYDRLSDRGFRVAAFNVSGNPLHPDPAIGGRHDSDLRRTIELAAELGVDRIVAMSGCPAAGPNASSAPHFAANAWLPDYAGVAEWQWEHRVGPYWQEIDELVGATSRELQICLELHPGAYVYNVETYVRLNARAPRIRVNLDPSHLFWQQMDPLLVIDRGSRPATLVDVARLVGVSASTVSNVVRGSNVVAAPTRRRVLAAIEELDYRPNALARQLLQGRATTVGIIARDLRNPFIAEMASLLEREVARLGFAAMFCATDGDPEREDQAIGLMLDNRVSGLVFLSLLGRPSLIAAKVGGRLPAVFVAAEEPWADSVTVDEHRGGEIVARHLVGLGHRRLAFLGPQQPDRADMRRLEGFL